MSAAGKKGLDSLTRREGRNEGLSDDGGLERTALLTDYRAEFQRGDSNCKTFTLETAPEVQRVAILSLAAAEARGEARGH